MLASSSAITVCPTGVAYGAANEGTTASIANTPAWMSSSIRMDWRDSARAASISRRARTSRATPSASSRKTRAIPTLCCPSASNNAAATVSATRSSRAAANSRTAAPAVIDRSPSAAASRLTGSPITSSTWPALIVMACARPMAPPPDSMSAIRRHQPSTASRRSKRSLMTRPDPISHGAQSPVADTTSPATGQPVTDHTATPAPHQEISRHRDPSPGRVADHAVHTARTVRRQRGGGPTACPATCPCRAPRSASITPTATAAPAANTTSEPVTAAVPRCSSCRPQATTSSRDRPPPRRTATGSAAP